MRTSLARQTADDLAPVLGEPIGRANARLGAIEAQLTALSEEVRELRSIVGTQVDVENQSTALLGQLLRSATTRIEELEERAEPSR
jgi:ABC-type transporter Mla subunit MlaD